MRDSREEESVPVRSQVRNSRSSVRGSRVMGSGDIETRMGMLLSLGREGDWKVAKCQAEGAAT